MRVKRFAAVLLVLLVPIASQAQDEAARADLPIPVIIGPNSAEPGDLVVLDASESSGQFFDWAVIPELSNDRLTILPIESGRKCILVSVPGTYTVVLAVATQDGIALKKHTVTVRGSTPRPDNPRPDNPRPRPDNPDDLTPVPPPDGEYKLAAFVLSIADKMPDKSKASSFAQAFDSVASEAAAGALRTPAQIDSATADANRKVISGDSRERWLPFFTALNEKLNGLSKSGDLRSVDDYVTAWGEIADGFRRVR